MPITKQLLRWHRNEISFESQLRENSRIRPVGGKSGSTCQGLSCEISAAYRSFHGGRPTGVGPISSQEDAGPCSYVAWTIGVHARRGGVGGMDFFDDGRFQQLGFASS